MNRQYVSVKELASRFGVSQLTIWRWSRGKNGFPSPIKLSANCTRWRVADIESWEEAQASAA